MTTPLDVVIFEGWMLGFEPAERPTKDAHLALAERQVDPAARAAHYLSVEQRLLRDYPAIPLYSGVAHRLVSPRIRGWTDNPGLALPSVHLSLG